MKTGREDKLYGKSVGGDAGCGQTKSRLQINLKDTTVSAGRINVTAGGGLDQMSAPSQPITGPRGE